MGTALSQEMDTGAIFDISVWDSQGHPGDECQYNRSNAVGFHHIHHYVFYPLAFPEKNRETGDGYPEEHPATVALMGIPSGLWHVPLAFYHYKASIWSGDLKSLCLYRFHNYYR